MAENLRTLPKHIVSEPWPGCFCQGEASKQLELCFLWPGCDPHQPMCCAWLSLRDIMLWHQEPCSCWQGPPSWFPFLSLTSAVKMTPAIFRRRCQAFKPQEIEKMLSPHNKKHINWEFIKSASECFAFRIGLSSIKALKHVQLFSKWFFKIWDITCLCLSSTISFINECL